MNEEPAWLRNDAVAHPRETDHERATAERTRKIAGRRQDPGPEAEASRALAAGQPERLRPGAVLHLQRAAGNAGVARLLGEDREPESPVKEVVGHGAGAPLDEAARERMEASFGEDFSDVRIHTGSSAAASAQALDAHAYTVGNEIVLGAGQTPGSPTHERTLAHELSHVVQQRSGPVDGTPAAGRDQRLRPCGPLRAGRGHDGRRRGQQRARSGRTRSDGRRRLGPARGRTRGRGGPADARDPARGRAGGG